MHKPILATTFFAIQVHHVNILYVLFFDSDFNDMLDL
uniref:Uncharacterized protein n=1 Tax=Rhizophora mucronata TaxID=61149 RepID=A0A2P2NF93_RHIMU